MTARVEEVSEVEVVLKASAAGREDEVRRRLAGAEMEIASAEAGVIRGTLPADRVAEIERMSCVARVSVRLTYITDRADISRAAQGASTY